MTLLEIMVRDWPSWPGDFQGYLFQRVYQDVDGDLIGSNGYSFREVLGHAEIASDRATAVVMAHRCARRSSATPDAVTCCWCRITKDFSRGGSEHLANAMQISTTSGSF